MSVSLRHPVTGELKVQPEGWSWGCFLGSFLLGLPLFRRGLAVWGSVMVAFNSALLVAQYVPTDRATAVYRVMSPVGIGLCVFFGPRANRMAIDRYLEHGWEFADPRLLWTPAFAGVTITARAGAAFAANGGLMR